MTNPKEAFKKNPRVPCKFASDFRGISPVRGDSTGREACWTDSPR